LDFRLDGFIGRRLVRKNKKRGKAAYNVDK
jgi:hypothetical protein